MIKAQVLFAPLLFHERSAQIQYKFEIEMVASEEDNILGW